MYIDFRDHISQRQRDKKISSIIVRKVDERLRQMLLVFLCMSMYVCTKLNFSLIYATNHSTMSYDTASQPIELKSYWLSPLRIIRSD